MDRLEKRTVLIGLDGATFTVLNPLMANGVMPFLKEFMASGGRGELLSVNPPITPSAWTSLATGKSPGNHGIFDFFYFESPTSRYVRFLNSRNIACETIWSLISHQGLRVTSLNFPVMMPTRPVSGFVIPGWVPARHIRRGCYPPRLLDRFQELPDFNGDELAIDPAIERVALIDCPEEEYAEWIRHHIRRDQQWFRVMTHLMKEEPCHLTAIVFDGVDKLQHRFWHYLHPACVPETLSPLEEQNRQLCLDYFRNVDEFIAEIVRLAGPEAHTVIASDHGFGPTVEVFYLNTWLHQNGYLEWTDAIGTAQDEEGTQDPLVILPRNYVRTLDWSRTKAHAITASSNAIHISVAGKRGKEGIPPEDYYRFRQELIDKLLAFKDPANGEAVVTRVWTREELFKGTQMEMAPDLTLDLRDRGFISTLRSEEVFKPRPKTIGTHHPEGVLVVAGPGVQPGWIPQRSILDVPSLLLYTLGLPIPEDFEGELPVSLFDPGFLGSHPVRIGEPTRAPAKQTPRKMEEVDETEEDQAAIAERLRALGYLE